MEQRATLSHSWFHPILILLGSEVSKVLVRSCFREPALSYKGMNALKVQMLDQLLYAMSQGRKLAFQKEQ